MIEENQPLLGQMYKEPPIISYKRGRSLKDILVKAKLSELKAINTWVEGVRSGFSLSCDMLQLTSCDNCPFYCAITSKKKKMSCLLQATVLYRQDQFALYPCSKVYKLFVLIQDYKIWKIRHHSTVRHCSQLCMKHISCQNFENEAWKFASILVQKRPKGWLQKFFALVW